MPDAIVDITAPASIASGGAPPDGSPQDAAEAAGLIYTTDDQPGLHRRRRGKTFFYVDAAGSRVKDAADLARIRTLAIPPAWSDVWICANPVGHLQATGRDVKARKQYRYHPRFREYQDAAKYEHIMEFAHALPVIRARVSEHMARRGLQREKVLATVVRLLETTLIRVGNDDYAKQNGSYGLTTLQEKHVTLEGAELRFHFKGKSGKIWKLKLRDRRVARVIKDCQGLPGQKLFQYRDDDGELREVTSADINAYLKEVSGRDITAKDFRTWAGTVLAAMALREFEAFDTQAKAKRNVRAAIERVSTRLGNTPAICRKCYIHPEILSSYSEGTLSDRVQVEIEATLREELALLTPEETAVLSLLRNRLQATPDETST
jgi:DNA topoisomerase-1